MTGKYFELLAKTWLETNWIKILANENLFNQLMIVHTNYKGNESERL